MANLVNEQNYFYITSTGYNALLSTDSPVLHTLLGQFTPVGEYYVFVGSDSEYLDLIEELESFGLEAYLLWGPYIYSTQSMGGI